MHSQDPHSRWCWTTDLCHQLMNHYSNSQHPIIFVYIIQSGPKSREKYIPLLVSKRFCQMIIGTAIHFSEHKFKQSMSLKVSNKTKQANKSSFKVGKLKIREHIYLKRWTKHNNNNYKNPLQKCEITLYIDNSSMPGK